MVRKSSRFKIFILSFILSMFAISVVEGLFDLTNVYAAESTLSFYSDSKVIDLPVNTGTSEDAGMTAYIRDVTLNSAWHSLSFVKVRNGDGLFTFSPGLTQLAETMSDKLNTIYAIRFTKSNATKALGVKDLSTSHKYEVKVLSTFKKNTVFGQAFVTSRTGKVKDAEATKKDSTGTGTGTGTADAGAKQSSADKTANENKANTAADKGDTANEATQHDMNFNKLIFLTGTRIVMYLTLGYFIYWVALLFCMCADCIFKVDLFVKLITFGHRTISDEYSFEDLRRELLIGLFVITVYFSGAYLYLTYVFIDIVLKFFAVFSSFV